MKPSLFHSLAIETLIKDADVNSKGEHLPVSDADQQVTVYVLGLKPEGRGRHQAPGWRAVLTDYAVRVFQPGSPVFSHVELIMPHAGKPGLFASYFVANGHGGANWQHPSAEDRDYYMSENAARWHAVPVRVTVEQAGLIQQAANDCVGAPYSFTRYFFSAYGGRKFAWLLPRGGANPGHCATVTARVLRAGCPSLLDRCEAWYGPSTLLAELHRKLSRGLTGIDVAASVAPMASLDDVQVDMGAVDGTGATFNAGLRADDTLLHGSDASVEAMPVEVRHTALDLLSDRVLDAKNGPERELNEILLARALCRAVLY
jgi:hypothetical protein